MESLGKLSWRRYVNTAACISRISYIDGDKGILRYRGYPIEELAEKSSYTEVSPAILTAASCQSAKEQLFPRSYQQKSLPYFISMSLRLYYTLCSKCLYICNHRTRLYSQCICARPKSSARLMTQYKDVLPCTAESLDSGYRFLTCCNMGSCRQSKSSSGGMMP